ncbi:DNA polymerase IV [Haloarcula nitratireducens]|uniref:DNA polymerase IV n=1 Tax=Haloarcula nitratireducens TaxID=2487749 RepID=A0AAW4P9L8_9EURY|nr:DNA polymerase IV [Halomicroarcula nitratireducens]MBX0294283.1 DNA polymerase IV [Halomicroarcula nitratireducens]
MDAARLPGTSQPAQVVAHVDMDCFYAACERRREPALEGEPLVVGMGYEGGETHGAVATASYEAREFGVESAMAISEALERLPRKVEAVDDPDLSVEEAGHYRSVDLDYYEAVAGEVKEIIRDAADVVREVSIDEAYLDVTETVAWDDAEAWAADLKATIESEVDVAASVGLAPTLSAAKVASDREKPDGLVVVRPGEVREFFADLPVEEVHGVGPVTARELAGLGIETAGDLADADPGTLDDRFGERGREIRRYARGEDTRAVTPKGDPKSLSRESAFTEAVDDPAEKRRKVETLAAAVADRAHRKEVRYQTIGIKVVEPPYEIHTRARSLPGPVADADLVESVALDLLSEFADAAVRKVGVRVSNLDFSAGEQASLTGFEGDDSATETQAEGGRTPDERTENGRTRRDAAVASSPETSDGQISLTDFERGEAGTEGADGEPSGETTEGDADTTQSDGQASLGDFE